MAELEQKKEYLVEEPAEKHITKFLKRHHADTMRTGFWLPLINDAVHEFSPDLKRARESGPVAIPFEGQLGAPEIRMTTEAIDALLLGAENFAQDIFEGGQRLVSLEEDEDDDTLQSWHFRKSFIEEANRIMEENTKQFDTYFVAGCEVDAALAEALPVPMLVSTCVLDYMEPMIKSYTHSFVREIMDQYLSEPTESIL